MSTMHTQPTNGWQLDSSSSSSSTTSTTATTTGTDKDEHPTQQIFQNLCSFLQATQSSIIQQLESMEGESGATFTKDSWGCFQNMEDDSNNVSSKDTGGITRVLQGGNVIEKGACSLTIIQQGVLTADRAQSIQSRQNDQHAPSLLVQAGDLYSAAALSIVLHSKSPMVPTFRSDVRIFLVTHNPTDGTTATTKAWFGGGADLTPYYLNMDNIKHFHSCYKNLAEQHGYDYPTMKKACDDYFYLVARSEHRGTGGIFFDDVEATDQSMEFVKGVANMWMPSWLPIVQQQKDIAYTDQQRQWQLLRRGRYLEFNLLYDRGVKFGLASANPRVEGVMVSAPPLIAWEYNHVIQPGSDEHQLMEILKSPIDWV